jgi:cell division protein FtsQ
LPALNGASRRARLRGDFLAGPVPARLLALGILLGSAGAGLAYSDDPSRLADAVGRAGGFEVRYVKLTGQKETSDSAIVAAVGLAPDETLLAVDAGAARRRLEALPWVTAATVRKVLPDTLNVEITEAEAAARWRLAGEETLVAADGTVLADEVPWRFRGLPLVAGRGANTRVPEAKALLDGHPGIASRVVAAVLVNERRWDLRLANGAVVKLPSDGASEALDRLAELESEGAILSAGPVVVDMRLPDRTTVQLEPPAPNAPEGETPALPAGPELDPLAAAIARATL